MNLELLLERTEKAAWGPCRLKISPKSHNEIHELMKIMVLGKESNVISIFQWWIYIFQLFPQSRSVSIKIENELTWFFLAQYLTNFGRSWYGIPKRHGKEVPSCSVRDCWFKEHECCSNLQVWQQKHHQIHLSFKTPQFSSFDLRNIIMFWSLDPPRITVIGWVTSLG